MEKIDNKIVIEPLRKKDFKNVLKSIRNEMKAKNISFTREEAIKDDLYD